MNLAVIPARGGSKRIPRKNIKPFCGKPMIAWSIAAARDSELFEYIIVSTDDDEIAAIAELQGAEVPFRRPASLADDHTGTHAIAWQQEQGRPVDYACCIYATAPFIQVHYLREGFEKRVASSRSYVFSDALRLV